VHPRSGPACGSDKGILILGSGFTENSKSLCIIDNVEYTPLEWHWNFVKCPLPPSKHGPNFFGNVNLEVTINGVDYKKFNRGFSYYP